MASTTASLTTATTAALTKPATDTMTAIQFSGTFTGVSFAVQGSYDNTNWFPVAAIRNDTGALTTGTIAATDSTVASWRVPSESMVGVRVSLSAIGSGTLAVALVSGSFNSSPYQIGSSTPSSSGAQWSNFKNVIDGGDFSTNPWQRTGNVVNTNTNCVTSTATYSADRWFLYAGNTNSSQITARALTDVPGFNTCARFGRVSANTNTTNVFFGQILESFDSIRFQGRTVTLSFWARGGATFLSTASPNNVLTAQIITGTGTDQSAANSIPAAIGGVPASWTGGGNAAVLNTTLTATSTRYSITGTVPANTTQVGVLFSYAPTGTAGATEYVELSGVQLEDGPQMTQFEHRDVQVELELAQRYFFNIPEPAAGVLVGIGTTTATNTQLIFIPLPVQMRAAPTVTATVGTFKFGIIGVATTAAGFAAGTTHTANYISIVGTTTDTAGRGVTLLGNGGTGSIAVSADL